MYANMIYPRHLNFKLQNLEIKNAGQIVLPLAVVTICPVLF